MPDWTNQGRGWYNEHLVASFPSAIHNISAVPDALQVFRRALAEAADGLQL